jgi:hypothetical protein
MSTTLRMLSMTLLMPVSLATGANAQERVGNGWSCTHYLSGDFTGDGKADLICRTSAGDMQLFPFVNGSFYSGGGPIKAGNGWSFTHYWAGDWTSDGVADLLVRTSAGELLLFPMKNNTFYDGGGPRKVGNGWANITDYIVSDFTGDGAPDMIVRRPNGDLQYYPWKGTSFY